MKQKTNVIEKTILFSWPYTIVVATGIYLFTSNWDFVTSFLLGAVASLLMSSWNYRWMKRAYLEAPTLIQRHYILSYVIRFVLFGVLLYITATNPESWNVYFTAVGILTYRIVLVPVVLIFGRTEGGDDVG